MAGTGPMPKRSGSTPAVGERDEPAPEASGRGSRAYAADVTMHRGRAVARLRRVAGGDRAARVKRRPERCQAPRADVSRRGPSSAANTTSRAAGFGPLRGARVQPAVTGDRHELVGEPAASAAAIARSWLRQRERVLILPRDRPIRARGSPRPVPWSGTHPGTCRRAPDSARACCPPIGTRLIDSVPPATMAEANPHMMRSAANAMAWRPDEQNRLIVTADADTGTPARRLAMRATFSPCSASGIAHPRITSSTSAAVEARRPAKRFSDHGGGQLVRPRAAEGSVRRLADRRANGGHDDGVSHASPPSRSSIASASSTSLPSNR